MKCRTTTLPRKSAKRTARPSAACNTKPGASLSTDWKYCSRSPRVVSSSLSEWADATGTIAVSDNASMNVRSNGIHSSTIRLPTRTFNKVPCSAPSCPARTAHSFAIDRSGDGCSSCCCSDPSSRHPLHRPHHAASPHRAGGRLTFLCVKQRCPDNRSDQSGSEHQNGRVLTHGYLCFCSSGSVPAMLVAASERIGSAVFEPGGSEADEAPKSLFMHKASPHMKRQGNVAKRNGAAPARTSPLPLQTQ